MVKRPYLFLLVVRLLILGFTFFGDRGVIRIYQLRRERQEMTERIRQLQGENERLRRQVDALKSDRRYLEHLARKELGLVKGNEIIYQFSPSSETLPAPPAAGGR
jgi:cell division protein FtsB